MSRVTDALALARPVLTVAGLLTRHASVDEGSQGGMRDRMRVCFTGCPLVAAA